MAKATAAAPAAAKRSRNPRPRPYKCPYCNAPGWDRLSLQLKHIQKNDRGTSVLPLEIPDEPELERMCDTSDSEDELESTPAPELPPFVTPAKALIEALKTEALKKAQPHPKPVWKTTSTTSESDADGMAAVDKMLKTGAERASDGPAAKQKRQITLSGATAVGGPEAIRADNDANKTKRQDRAKTASYQPPQGVSSSAPVRVAGTLAALNAKYKSPLPSKPLVAPPQAGPSTLGAKRSGTSHTVQPAETAVKFSAAPVKSATAAAAREDSAHPEPGLSATPASSRPPAVRPSASAMHPTTDQRAVIALASSAGSLRFVQAKPGNVADAISSHKAAAAKVQPKAVEPASQAGVRLVSSDALPNPGNAADGPPTPITAYTIRAQLRGIKRELEAAEDQALQAMTTVSALKKQKLEIKAMYREMKAKRTQI